MSTPARWTLAFFDAKGNDTSRGWTGVSLTDTARRAFLRFECNPEVRYATLALNGHPFALIAVAQPFMATVTAIAVDERQMTDKERRAIGHIENMLRSGVRVHLRGNVPLWRLHRQRPTRP